jgi:DNA-binding beta-propeller fold protein YncE
VDIPLLRRPLLVLAVAVASLTALVAVPADARSGPPAGLPSGTAHEVWALDQGTDRIHVLDERGDAVADIDVSPPALAALGVGPAPTGATTVPHMIDFDSQYRYAFVAATAGARTIVIDAAAKEVVAVLDTGAGSHMAAVTPDDSAVWVAAIGAQRMVEIELPDLDQPAPTFAIGRELAVGELLADIEEDEGWDFSSGPDSNPANGYAPVCHQYSPDGTEAWVTLGPGPRDGGLFVLDLASGTVTDAWDPEQVRANCGVGFNHDGTRVVANWSGDIGPGVDSEGEWYVFDAQSKELLQTNPARGFDAHGVRFTPDGRELWAVNRISDNALIIDGRTFEVRREIDDIAATPDILDFSPDGRQVYVTQRGPTPRSGGTHAASGPQPGVAVIDRASARRLQVWEPPRVEDLAGNQLNDVHGVGVRPVDAAEVRDRPAADDGRPTVERRAGAERPVATERTAAATAAHGFHCSLPPA